MYRLVERDNSNEVFVSIRVVHLAYGDLIVHWSVEWLAGELLDLLLDV